MTVATDAAFTRAEEHELLANAARGTWPLYLPSTVAFAQGRTTITTTVPGGRVVVLGRNVLRMGRYLGHDVRV